MKDNKKTKEQLLQELTQLRQQNAELKASKAKDTSKLLNALADNSTIGIYIVQDGKFRFVNSMFQRYVGYSEEELLNMDSLDIVYPEDRSMVRENAVKMLKIKSTSPYEFRYVNKEGECLWVMESVTSVQYEGRQATLGSFIDTTQRKQIEEKYRQLLDNTNDGYVVVQDRKIVFANRRFGDIFGYKLGQISGKPLDELLIPDDRQVFLDLHNRVMRGEEAPPTRHKGLAIKSNGTKIFIEASIKLIQYESKPSAYVIVKDITEHKQMEGKYRHLVEDMSDGYVVIQDMNIVFANNSFARILGCEIEEILGKPTEQFMMTNNGTAELEQYEKVMRGEKEIPKQYQTTMMKSDGTVITVDTTMSAIEYENKPAICIIVRDVTEQNRTEEKFQELYEKEIKLREGLEEERKKRIEFTRVLVHELKTPLTPVMAASHLLSEEVEDETLKRLAKNIKRGASNLSNRIDDLLDMVRGEIGILHLEFKLIDPLLLLRSVADEISPVASQQEHALIVDLPNSLPPVQADENRLRQVILNLLNNASKFTPGGGMITLRAREKGTALVVEVQDTGPGIDKEDQERLFDPYYRVESDRQRFSGMGLGLALCKTLVDHHKGQIWVESCPGEGATFGFSLPLEA